MDAMVGIEYLNLKVTMIALTTMTMRIAPAMRQMIKVKCLLGSEGAAVMTLLVVVVVIFSVVVVGFVVVLVVGFVVDVVVFFVVVELVVASLNLNKKNISEEPQKASL